ncbi:MAG: prolipoprotein diacylglyceryl transferase [Elusimicrobiota bacterium]|jgi:phosphatidylglycerol:prolipoprotein diacylglycerol transferase|nr:prolipoprotein diacylglyceryl transferase [Elusimicrobiota bacterium]
MYPVLLNLGFFKIHTYGLMIAIGFVLSGFLFVKKATKTYNYDSRIIDNLMLWLFIAGIIGGRFFYIILNWSYYSKNLLEIPKIWQGGLVFFGAFIFAFLFLIFFTKIYKKISFLRLADLLAPYLALGHFFGRIGCFFAGCCYGKPTNSHFGVIFKNTNSLAPLNIKIHPTQLYEAFSNLILFFVLLYFLKKQSFKGQILSLYLILYSTIRFFIEFLRNDPRGDFLYLSTSQIISIFLFFIGICLFFVSKNSFLKPKKN